MKNGAKLFYENALRVAREQAEREEAERERKKNSRRWPWSRKSKSQGAESPEDVAGEP